MSAQAGPQGARRGLFVVLDGIDGCGKSTQAERLVAALDERAERGERERALHVREPGSTHLGESLRSILLAREHDLAPRVETLLFAAARAQMLAELVEPALSAGRHVVCERFHPATFAYQAVAGGLPEREVLDLLERWAGAPKPDLVILFLLRPEIAATRRGAAQDRIEDKGLEFQRRVADGYARYAMLVPGTVTIDAARSADAVARDVLAEVKRALH